MKQNIVPGTYIQILGDINELSQKNQKYYFQEGKVIKKATTKASYLILFEDGNKKWIHEKNIYETPFKFSKIIDESNDVKLTLEMSKINKDEYHIMIAAWHPNEIMYRRWDDEKGKNERTSEEWKSLLRNIKENIFDNINSYNELNKYDLKKY